MHGTETGQSARFRPPTTISIEKPHPSSPHLSPPRLEPSPNHTTMPTPPSPWYSAFAIPQPPPTPNMSLYVFQDKTLEQQVYSSQMQWLGIDNRTANPSGDERVETVRKENEVLRWLGECVLRGLTGVLLMTLFPELEARSLEHLSAALQTKSFYAHLARVIGLHNNLVALTYAASDSDLILGSLFAAYIGAIHRDMGIAGSSNLHAWFSQLVVPYAQAYRAYYDQFMLTTHLAAPFMSAVQYPNPPSTVAMDILRSSAESKARRQNVSVYTSRLMEYAAKYHLPQPHFTFQDNGYQGALIEWTATVGVGGKEVATAIASTKLEAKHLASKEALLALRAPTTQIPSIRRTKKLNSRRMMIG